MINLIQKFFLYNLLIAIGCCSNTQSLCASVDPLSKIIITSTNATCVKDAANKDQFVFQYRDNVRVEFADKSTVTADLLDVVFDGNMHKDTKKNKKSDMPNLSNFKQITFKNHVCITSAQRKAIAQSAQFYLKDQRCVLDGDVKIWQIKQASQDIPVAIQSQKAELNLTTGEVQLLGSTDKPVSTIIVLEGHPGLTYKKKTSSKKKK